MSRVVRRLCRGDGLKPSDIGIISFYTSQIADLKRSLHDLHQRGSEFENGVEIKTVDGFQGGEREVIVLSCVRANAQKRVGFLAD